MDDHNLNLPTDLLEQLTDIQRLLERLRLRRQQLHGSASDPYRGQGKVLALLRDQPEISQKELFRRANMRAQSLSELLAKLEKAGLIARSPSLADRRQMDIRLTQAGRQAAPTQPDGAFNCLEPEEQAAFDRYLRRVAATLRDQLDGTDAPGTQDPATVPVEQSRGMLAFGQTLAPFHGRFDGYPKVKRKQDGKGKPSAP